MLSGNVITSKTLPNFIAFSIVNLRDFTVAPPGSVTLLNASFPFKQHVLTSMNLVRTSDPLLPYENVFSTFDIDGDSKKIYYKIFYL